jgi:hypothetical protein
MAIIVEYSDRQPPENRYPHRIIFPAAVGPLLLRSAW